MSKKNEVLNPAEDEARADDTASVEQAAEPEAGKQTGTRVSRAEEESGAAGTENKSRVYCGPSVRNVARQYTVYAGEIPDALREFIRTHPAAGGLLVPVEKFAETRRKLETKGTAEAVLYNKVKSEL